MASAAPFGGFPDARTRQAAEISFDRHHEVWLSTARHALGITRGDVDLAAKVMARWATGAGVDWAAIARVYLAEVERESGGG